MRSGRPSVRMSGPAVLTDALPRTGIHVGSWPSGLPERGSLYTKLAQATEAAGFDLLFAGDHIFTHNSIPEALTVIGWCAAATTRLVVGTGVLVLPLREPALAAKQLATIDYLSGGRLIVGIGVGGEMEAEWRALEIPLQHRGHRTDEYLAVLQQLWTGEPVDHHGRFRSISGVAGSPTPSQAGGPPVWIGGRGDAALRRAARYSGWCAYAVSPRRLRSSIDQLRELRGGDMENFRISCVLFTAADQDGNKARAQMTEILSSRYDQDFDRFIDAFCAVGTPEEVAGRIEEYRSAGVDDILLAPQVPAERFIEQVELLGESVVHH